MISDYHDFSQVYPQPYTVHTDRIEDSKEYHLPFHNYAGPGTHILEKLRNHVAPTTDFDKASMIHDIEYLYLPQRVADDNMWKNLVRESIFNIPAANFARAAFYLKDIVGYQTDKDQIGYVEAKQLAKSQFDLGNMKFHDET